MKRIVLVAHELVDGKKVELGRDEDFPVCESVGDIMDLCDGASPEMTEAQVIGAFNSGNKVRRQASLRSPAKKQPDSPAVIAFKKASPDEQTAMLASGGKL